MDKPPAHDFWECCFSDRRFQFYSPWQSCAFFVVEAMPGNRHCSLIKHISGLVVFLWTGSILRSCISWNKVVKIYFQTSLCCCYRLRDPQWGCCDLALLFQACQLVLAPSGFHRSKWQDLYFSVKAKMCTRVDLRVRLVKTKQIQVLLRGAWCFWSCSGEWKVSFF